MIPLSVTPSPRGFVPWLTISWIVLTVVAFGLVRWQPAPAFAAVGFGASAASAALALFVHPNGFQLLVGGWVLGLFGANVEQRVGRLRFAVGAAVSGLVALQATAWAAPHEVSATGAGGIGAVLGAAFVLFPHNQVTLIGLGRRHVGARRVLGLVAVVGGVAVGWEQAAMGIAPAVGFALGGLGAAGFDRFGGDHRTRAARTRLGGARDAPERAQVHVEIGERLVDDDPVGAFHHAVSALEDLPSPETARRAREILRALCLHPTLAERYRVYA